MTSEMSTGKVSCGGNISIDQMLSIVDGARARKAAAPKKSRRPKLTYAKSHFTKYPDRSDEHCANLSKALRESTVERSYERIIDMLPATVPDEIVIKFGIEGTADWYAKKRGMTRESASGSLKTSERLQNGISMAKRVVKDPRSENVWITRVFYRGTEEDAVHYSMEELENAVAELKS